MPILTVYKTKELFQKGKSKFFIYSYLFCYNKIVAMINRSIYYMFYVVGSLLYLADIFRILGLRYGFILRRSLPQQFILFGQNDLL